VRHYSAAAHAHPAASLIRTQYKQETPKLDFIAGFPSSYPGSHTGIPGDVSFGDVDSGLQQAEIKIEQIYTTPIQHHNRWNLTPRSPSGMATS
jgi:xanthine dehydrogenase YagR molybdenum-binding subunit